jgi:hypothetical protein
MADYLDLMDEQYKELEELSLLLKKDIIEHKKEINNIFNSTLP